MTLLGQPHPISSIPDEDTRAYICKGLYDVEDFDKVADMKFICQGESFKAISAMLNCYIPYWKRDHPNTANKVIEMNDIDSKVLELFLIYIHLGSIILKTDTAAKLLLLSQRLNVANLSQSCREYFNEIGRINIDNYNDLVTAAGSKNSKQLRETLQGWTKHNFDKLFSDNNELKLTKEALLFALRVQRHCKHEKCCTFGVNLWLHHQLENGDISKDQIENDAWDLYRHIQWRMLDSAIVDQLFEEDPLISEDKIKLIKEYMLDTEHSQNGVFHYHGTIFSEFCKKNTTTTTTTTISASSTPSVTTITTMTNTSSSTTTTTTP